jgi:hypothetical protein
MRRQLLISIRSATKKAAPPAGLLARSARAAYRGAGARGGTEVAPGRRRLMGAVASTLWEAHDAKFFSDNFRREISLACKFPVRLQRTVPHLVGLAIINDYDPAGRHP